MLKNIWFIVTRDLGHMLRRRETLVWAFVMPVVFFYFIGGISGGFGRMSEPDPIAVSEPQSAGFLADELVARLGQRNFRVMQREDYFRRVQIPQDFTSDVLAGRPVKVKFVRYGSGVNTDYEETRLNRALNGLASDIAVLKGKGIAPSPEAFADLARHPGGIAVHVTSSGKRKVPPIGFEQAVPGMLVMFTMLILLHAAGGAAPGHPEAAGVGADLPGRGSGGEVGRPILAGPGADRIRDDHRNGAFQGALGRPFGCSAASVGFLRRHDRRIRDAAGELRAHRRPGDRHGSDP
jgi:hypothetical protein